ncbi:ABC transporter ATP-binding protein [Chelatococcus sp. GCM10030263]|uniref:ABC transporter ATP-binding protein n=1 Tax=Chelatococcus sp. GCM10030263 TaxID=3273387 RepID=UPI00360CA69C
MPSADNVSADGAGLEVKAVVKRFGPFTAVDGVSFSVRRGELVSLLGPSGCGKTTILRMLGGLEYPDGGAIILGGNSIEHLPPYRRNIGFVFQRYALFPHMTVAGNIAYPLAKRGVARNERLERVDRALDLVGLSGFADRNPTTLSGGQQQRVALARAIVFEPQVLLLDEPLGALDKQLRDRMQFEVRRIQRTLGITTIFVTHDQIEAMAISDRIAIMKQGRIEQFGTASELYARPATEFVASFIGESNLLNCDVSNTAEGPIAKLANGFAVRAASAEVSGPARLLLRPECVEISSSAADVSNDNSAQARVEEVVYLGESTRVVVNLSGVRLMVRVTNNHLQRVDLRPGGDVRLNWRASDTLILPRESGLAAQPGEAVT